MSKPHSQMPPTASPGADSDAAAQADLDLMDAGRRLAALGIFGLIVIDRDLRVRATIGDLVGFIDVGELLSESLPPVVGLEDEILKLRDRTDAAIELPAVSMAAEQGPGHKLNFTFFWSTERDAPSALVHKTDSQTEIETELSKQIRARLMAEAEVIANSKELARANADLESFASIVSHDLKAPLRHMRHLIEKAAAELHAGQDAATREALDSIDVQSRRMSEMLTALLDYSTLGRKYEAIEPVDTRALVEDIRNSLPRSGHTIDIAGTWPVIQTLRAPLDLVLRNLMANALQHHDRANGTVVVSCEEDATALKIAVRDDGPGIDPRHHQAIFLPFRTLSTDPRSTASGMGLASVRKTLDAIRGTIAVQSGPASTRGTTFIVTWPKSLAV